jgi:hypothetical protein
LTLDHAKEFYREIRELKKRYGVSYSDYHEEERDGQVRFVNITVRAKIDPSTPETVRRAGPEKPNKIRQSQAK